MPFLPFNNLFNDGGSKLHCCVYTSFSLHVNVVVSYPQAGFFKSQYNQMIAEQGGGGQGAEDGGAQPPEEQ